MRRILIAIFMLTLTSYVIVLANTHKIVPNFEVADYYVKNAYTSYQTPNIVTSIYLVYRYYDTLFEALMLMFSLIGVIYMSVHEGDHEDDKR